MELKDKLVASFMAFENKGNIDLEKLAQFNYYFCVQR